MAKAETIERLMLAALAGERAAWPQSLRDADSERLWQTVVFDGLCGQLAECTHLLICWPDQLVQRIQDQARMQALWEHSHHTSIAGLIEAAHAAGISSAVMKGSALAYSLYPNPAHRPRGDTDLLISRENRSAMRACLTAQGYVPAGKPSMLQEVWEHRTGAGFTHQIDLHWGLSNSPYLAQPISAAELLERAVPLPGLSTHARAIDPVWQLIQTALNQYAHQHVGFPVEGRIVRGRSRLLWLLDTHLQSAALDTVQWAELVEVAKASGLHRVMLASLSDASGCLGSDVPDIVLEALGQYPESDRAQLYYATHSKDAPPLSTLKLDMAAAKGWRAKASVLQAHVLPDLTSQQTTDAASNGSALWQLHLNRILRAGRRLAGASQ